MLNKDIGMCTKWLNINKIAISGGKEYANIYYVIFFLATTFITSFSIAYHAPR